MLIDHAQAFETCETIESIWDHLLTCLTREGIGQVIYISVDAQRQNPFVLTNVPDVYATADPATDPFLSHICTSYTIVPTGPDFLPDYDYLPPEAQAFIREAEKVGWRTGMGIPMRLQGSDRYGGFNLGTSLDKDTFLATIMPKAEAFRTFCLLAHRRIEEISEASPLTPSDGFRDLLVAPEIPGLGGLSPREREVLYLIGQGISRKRCAQICGISPHTIGEYTKSAYRKLGISNRAEAAVLINKRAS